MVRTPSASWACSARSLARGERRGQDLVVGRVYLLVVVSERSMCGWEGMDLGY